MPSGVWTAPTRPVSKPDTVGPTVNGARYLQLFATEPLVVATPCIQWLPVSTSADGAALVELAEWKMVAIFGCRARLGCSPADQAAGRARNLLTLQLTATFWSRYLSELVASDFLSETFLHRRSIQSKIAKLVPANSGALSKHQDIALVT